MKHKTYESIERFKAKLVIKGYTQQARNEYTTHIVKMTTVVKKMVNISQPDVNNIFLHGNLHEKVYMQVPPGLVVNKSA